MEKGTKLHFFTTTKVAKSEIKLHFDVSMFTGSNQLVFTLFLAVLVTSEVDRKVKIIQSHLKSGTLATNCEPCGDYPHLGSIKEGRNGYKLAIKKEFRIVGGSKAMHSRPWMAFLLINFDYRCSGSLINHR